MSSIISTTDLNSFTQKTLTPAVAARVVKAVNAYIESRTNRCWGDTTTVSERYDWQRVIWLRHQDVQSIINIKSGYPGQLQETFKPTAYMVNSLGRLTFFSGLYGYGLFRANASYSDWLEITYEYGVEDVPEDLKFAALGIAASFYNWAISGQRELTATQVGSYRVEYAGSSRSGSSSDRAADTNFSIIASYATKRA